MHGASMNSRYRHLSCANSSKSSQHSSPASRLIVRIHVSFGLPLPLLPCTCQPGVPCTITPSLLKTCPSHFHRDNLIYSFTGCVVFGGECLSHTTAYTRTSNAVLCCNYVPSAYIPFSFLLKGWWRHWDEPMKVYWRVHMRLHVFSMSLSSP